MKTLDNEKMAILVDVIQRVAFIAGRIEAQGACTDKLELRMFCGDLQEGVSELLFYLRNKADALGKEASPHE